MRKILIVGAGKSSPYLIKYLLDKSQEEELLIHITDLDTNPSDGDWLVYDSTVAGNDTTFITVGITLTAGQYLKISSSENTTTFICFLSEIS